METTGAQDLLVRVFQAAICGIIGQAFVTAYSVLRAAFKTYDRESPTILSLRVNFPQLLSLLITEQRTLGKSRISRSLLPSLERKLVHRASLNDPRDEALMVASPRRKPVLN